MAGVLKAFICYRREDSYIPVDDGAPDFAFIDSLAGALKTAGFYDVFVDTGAITPVSVFWSDSRTVSRSIACCFRNLW